MSLFRRDIISIARISLPTGKGAQGYEDLTPEVILFTGVPADIQYRPRNKKLQENLPGDTDGNVYPEIFFRLPRDSVLTRDIIIDQNNIRFQIISPYWTVFQYQCVCERLIT